MLLRTPAGVAAGLLASMFGFGFVLGHGMPMNAQAKDRVFEIRTYTMEEGKLDAVVKRMRSGEARIFEKVGMNNILYAVAAEPPRSANTLVYIVAHESLERAKQSWAKFREDPEWVALRQASSPTGQIKIDSIFVNPVDFSPLK